MYIFIFIQYTYFEEKKKNIRFICTLGQFSIWDGLAYDRVQWVQGMIRFRTMCSISPASFEQVIRTLYVHRNKPV